MPKATQAPVDTALTAFRENARKLMALQGIGNDSELWRLVNKSGGGLSRKTVNNALKIRHDAQIGTLEALAQTLGVPLWIMFIPGLADTDLQTPHKERLIALVQNYLRCDNTARIHAESLAAAFAAKASK